MVFQVNLLIYLYMAICICLLLFNLVYFARDFFKRKRDPEMVRKYMNKLCEMLETSGVEKISREFDSWISEKSTCRSHKTCFFCVKFLVFIYCILLQCVVKYNKGGILHASYYIEI